MYYSLRLRAVAVAVFALASGVSFQTASAQTLPSIEVSGQREPGENYAPTNTTTGLKIEAQQKDVPQTVNVITSDVMRDQGARSLQDVMKNVPGVGIATGDGQRDAFVIRGFTALYDILLDGVRDDSQYFRDLYNIDRIEILKGPAAVLYGRGSSGGLINRITKKPDFTPSAEVGVTVGSNDLKRTEFNINRPVGDSLAFRIDGAYEDSGSYRSQGYLKNKDISPSLLWKDGNQSLLLQYDYQHQRRAIDFGVPGYRGAPANVSPSTYYGALNASANDYTESEVQSTTAQYKLRLSDKTSFSNTFRYFDYTLDRNHTRAGTINDTLAIPTVQLSRGNIARHEYGWFNQTELTHDMILGGMRHQILAGVEFGEQNKYQYVNNSTAAPYAYTTSLLNPVLQNLPFTVATAPQNKGVATLDTAGIYIQDLISLTSQLKTLLGVRFDRFGQKYKDQLSGANLDRTDNAFSPRAGLVWQPTANQSYYASYSKSFQPSGEGGAIATTNAQLTPENTRNLEIGTKIDLFEGRASFNAAIYQLVRTNVKYTDPVTNLLIPVGQQETKGLELSFTGEVAKGWQVIAGYSYMDSKITKALGTTRAPFTSATNTPIEGKTPSLTPRHTASLWTLKSLDQWVPGVQVGGGLTYRGENYAALDNAVKLPSFTTVDMAAYYRPSPKGINVTLNLKNVLNKSYYISANNDSGIMPGSPRSVELTARYMF
ncbi:TonB-dependent siderophore receptor [Herbaspirillum lusitanum]|uniref:TonB-dependent receptor n=1 Tax=Herbaspirillum lusitanum TaxID=213312 RepID=UPI00223870E0|nr:TonB-dependent siderophore receptor [Herbaspirillum lusitanum]MCW5300090.1 TonB-dependent siderophore receptor [Herbaspirillum lusitanum]